MTDTSEEYAKALFSLAEESGADLAEELAQVGQILDAQPDYIELLACPAIPLAERTAAVRQALGGRVAAQIVQLIAVMTEHGDIRALPGCIARYREMDMAKQQQAEARIVSAVDLSDDEKTRLLDRLCRYTGHTVTAKWETDPALLGGAAIYIGGKVLDGSLRRRLHDMKEVIDQ